MALAQTWKFEMGNRKLVASSTRPSLKHQLRTHLQNVLHIVSGCSMLAQNEYKSEHDKVFR